MSTPPQRVVMAENLVWDAGVRVGSHHYAQCMATLWGARVLWIALPWTPFHFLARNHAARARRQAWRLGAGIQPHERIRVLSPLALIQYRNLPGLRMPAVARWALRTTLPPLKRQIRRLGFDRPDVLWISDPRHAALLDSVRPSAVIYRCPDRFASFADIPASVTRLEREVVRRADLVVAPSVPLVDHLRELGASPLYVPNGVALDAFKELNGGDALSSVPRPRILYAGAMGEWFDSHAVERLAAARPEYHVVLAGPIRHDLGALLARSNVHYLGVLPYDGVLALMVSADVGVVPFRRSAIGAAVSPIKMFEYLAAGLPVVVTGIDDLAGLRSVVRTPKTDDEFVGAIDAALHDRRDPALAPRLRRLARGHSWQARFATISRALGLPVGRITCASE